MTPTITPTSTRISTPPSTAPGSVRPSRPSVRRAVTGTVAALAGNALLFAIGSIGEPIRVVTGADAAPSLLPLGHVAATTMIASAIGTGALWLTRWRRLSDRTWATAQRPSRSSLPSRCGASISTTHPKVLVTAMHLFTGTCCVAAHTIRTARTIRA